MLEFLDYSFFISFNLLVYLEYYVKGLVAEVGVGWLTKWEQKFKLFHLKYIDT